MTVTPTRPRVLSSGEIVRTAQMETWTAPGDVADGQVTCSRDLRTGDQITTGFGERYIVLDVAIRREGVYTAPCRRQF